MTHQQLCAELYALKPEWKTDSEYLWVEAHQEYEQDNGDPTNKAHPPIPNYTLEWCLAKLPAIDVEGIHLVPTLIVTGGLSKMFYAKRGFGKRYATSADTPTNAALKLLIELVKQGILSTGKESK